FVGERYLELAASLRPDLTGLRHLVCLDGRAEGMASYDELLAGQPSLEASPAVDDADPAVLLYTSGTTARPKGVVLTHLGLSVYVANTVEPASPETHDVLLLSVPLYHVAGATAIVSSVWGGRTLVILPQFDPQAWLEAAQGHRVTHSFVVPTMLKRIMEQPDFARYDLSSLRLLAYGAAPMPYEVVTRAVQLFRCGLMNAYGQTETTSTLTYLGPEDHMIPDSPPEEREKRLRRLRSVGRAMGDVTVAIMGPDGHPLPPGQEGEIVAQGERLMAGYWKREEETARTFRDGWLHTGDLGWMDEDGYVYISGRARELIIRGGENIAPGEVEAALAEHPQVAEAAAIGVPDEEWGEEVKAIVVARPGAKPTPEELTAFCKERLASYKAPRYYAFVSELPRNDLGKVARAELRKQYGEAKSEGQPSVR
ncbi:MAG: class I adenylate-forming enzyme family protein, partial [Dehalococcoidia bacterium]